MLDKWDIKAFRQRTPEFTLSINKMKFKQDNIKYLLIKNEDPKKVNIFIFFTNFKEEKRDFFGNIAYLIMDNTL